MFCMTLRARLAAGILAIAIVLVTPLTLALRSLDQLHASVIQLRNNEFAASLLLGRLRGATGDLSRAEDNLLILHDSASLGRMTAQISALKAMTDSLAGYALDTAATNIRAGLDEVARTAPLEYHAAAAGHAQSARADTISINHARPAISRMEGWISAAEGSLNERTSARAEIAATRAERARHFAAGVLVFAAGLATVIAVWLTRSVSRPVRDVEAGMAAVAGGEFSHRLTVAANRHDEFGRLAASFASMTKQLAELDKLKAEFVSVASHELKTPVNVMLGYLQLLQEGVYGELTDRQIEICRVLEQQGQAVGRLVKQLLDVSRFEAGGGKLEPRRFGLGPFLDELQTSFQVLALQRGIQFLVVRGQNLPTEVVWDRDRISEVLGNLLSNAFKFTPKAGRVELGAHADDETIRMYVRDTGAGIPAEQLPRIFDKFYQADNQRSASGEGTGLGLAIAKGIVEAHRGTIIVNSAEGSGTVFSLTLPASLPSRRGRTTAPDGAPIIAHRPEAVRVPS